MKNFPVQAPDQWKQSVTALKIGEQNKSVTEKFPSVVVHDTRGTETRN
jgi:hypothetical protein